MGRMSHSNSSPATALPCRLAVVLCAIEEGLLFCCLPHQAEERAPGHQYQPWLSQKEKRRNRSTWSPDFPGLSCSQVLMLIYGWYGPVLGGTMRAASSYGHPTAPLSFKYWAYSKWDSHKQALLMHFHCQACSPRWPAAWICKWVCRVPKFPCHRRDSAP